jgi:ubiquitin thioesterase protein OTUB1
MSSQSSDLSSAVDAHRASLEFSIRSQPLVGPLLSLEELDRDFQGNSRVLAKVAELKADYDGFRRVRGDGSCFYRGYLYRILELCMDDHGEQSKASIFEQFINKQLEIFESCGHASYIVEDFVDTVRDLLTYCRSSESTIVGLLDRLSVPGVNDYLMAYARLLTACHMKLNAEQFQPFVPENFASLDSYIDTQINPVNCDADYLACVALSSALGQEFAIKILYLDQSPGKLNSFIFPEGSDPTLVPIHLLFRPGHYDIIYKNEAKK